MKKAIFRTTEKINLFGIVDYIRHRRRLTPVARALKRLHEMDIPYRFSMVHEEIDDKPRSYRFSIISLETTDAGFVLYVMEGGLFLTNPTSQ